MIEIILLHGKPKLERYLDPNVPKPHRANWFPWVRKQMVALGNKVHVPPLPKPYAPVYKAWRDTILDLSPSRQTKIVAHSASASAILRLMSENNEIGLDTLVLVAPWVDPESRYGDFGKFTIDPAIIERVGRLVVFYDSNDDLEAQKSLEIVREALPTAEYRDLPGYGHFIVGNSMKNGEFPELVEVLAA